MTLIDTSSKTYRNTVLVLLGLVAGMIGTILGIGGGAVVVPVLVVFLDYDFKKAAGTSLLTIIFTAAIGCLIYYIWDIRTSTGNMLWLTAGLASVGSVIGAAIGALATTKIKSKFIRRIFILVLLFTSFKLLNIIKLPTEHLGESGQGFLVVLGFAAGFLSAILGIGGGIILVPFLTLFFVKDIHHAIPTSLLIIVPTTIMGVIMHRKLNNIDFAAAKLLIPFAAIGAVIGVFVKNQLPAETLKLVFGLYLLLCVIKLMLKNNKKSVKTEVSV